MSVLMIVYDLIYNKVVSMPEENCLVIPRFDLSSSYVCQTLCIRHISQCLSCLPYVWVYYSVGCAFIAYCIHVWHHLFYKRKENVASFQSYNHISNKQSESNKAINQTSKVQYSKHTNIIFCQLAILKICSLSYVVDFCKHYIDGFSINAAQLLHIPDE